ncbi:MAG: YitT family protein [Bacilli bacterium]|nr:YitT family protein [Bacilli bacterium]
MTYGKSKKVHPIQKNFMSIICVITAAIIMSINIKTFVRAGGLLPGGFTGLSLLIQRIGNVFFNIEIPYSFINILLNAVPAYIGFKTIGKRFTIYSVMMIILNSVLVDFIPTIPVTSDPLLVAVFGGILNGLAISIALKGNASSGGTDFISVYLSERFNMNSWNIVLGLNVCILLASGVLFGFEAALYSIIFQFVSTQVIEKLHQRNQQMTLMIVSDNADTLSQELLEFTHHGVTRFEGIGCYKGENRTMLYMVVGADEVNDVIGFIKTRDSKAFINIMKSVGIKGNFYKEPIE